VDVTSQPGGDTESVEVTADQIALLQTSDASVGATTDGEEIEKLPAYGADPYEVFRKNQLGLVGMGFNPSIFPLRECRFTRTTCSEIP
jgi:hypothetical protein